MPGGESDAALAARVAVAAGELLVELRDDMFRSGRRDWQVMDAVADHLVAAHPEMEIRS